VRILLTYYFVLCVFQNNSSHTATAFSVANDASVFDVLVSKVTSDWPCIEGCAAKIVGYLLLNFTFCRGSILKIIKNVITVAKMQMSNV